MKKSIVLVLLSCCIFLYGSEKVVIERSADSGIESIAVENDFLIIRNKGKAYTFKISDLLKDKTEQTTRSAPKTLQEAFKYNSKWFFFNVVKSRRNRLCYLNNKKKKYKVFKQGDLFKRVLYKNKYYARSLNKYIFRPDWEIKNDFSTHFIPARQYIKALENKIRLLKIKIETIEVKIPTALLLFKSAVRSYNLFLIINSIKITDTKNDSDAKDKSVKHSKKTKKELQVLHQEIEKRENELKSLMESLDPTKDELHKLQEIKRKLDALYQKYVINNSNEPPKIIPENICF